MASTIYVRIAMNDVTPGPEHLTDETGAIIVPSKDWTPGLAVTRRVDGKGFNVTHRASGMSIGGTLRTRKLAVEVMGKLDPLTDWTLDKETLEANLSEELVAKLRAIYDGAEPEAKVRRARLPERAAVEALAEKGPWKGSGITPTRIEGRAAWAVIHPGGGWMILWMTAEDEESMKDILDKVTVEVKAA